MSSNKIALAALAVLCIFIIIPVLRWTMTRETDPGSNTADVPNVGAVDALMVPEEPAMPQRESISEATVEGLYLGHSYESVEELFGLVSDSSESEYDRGIEGYTSPFTIVWHTWENPDGTRVRLGFVNDKLERKQFLRRDGELITNEVNLEDLE